MKNNAKPLVVFEIEENAEQLFLDSLQKLPENLNQQDAIPNPSPSKKRSKPQQYQLDLHGLRVAEAENFILEEMKHLFKNSQSVFKVRFITGKGRHSGAAGGVLVRVIYGFVKSQYSDFIISIDENPFLTRFNEVPFKGHFDAIFRKGL